jgi:hypothetical protein
MLDELRDYAPAFQLIASTALTVCSLIVAALAALFTYRNNFGWAPIVLVTEKTIKEDVREKAVGVPVTLLVQLQVWNRRKYPIQTVRVLLGFEGLNLVTKDPQSLEDLKSPIVESNRVHWQRVREIAPSDTETIDMQVPFVSSSRGVVEDITSPMKVILLYFDPRANKQLTTQVTSRWGFVIR